jgi:hypothetical protein
MNSGALSNVAYANRSTGHVLANFAAFQAGWFASVLGGAHGAPWFGLAVTALVVAWHLGTAARPGIEARLLVLAAVLGASWDSALVALGWIDFASGTLFAGMAPGWIVALWVLFATTLNVSLNWLKGRYWLAAGLGAVAGPLAYYGGAKLGAVGFPEPVLALGALSVGWALFMPLLMRLATRFDGIAAEPAR